MPRPSDPTLELRILNAAHRLWKHGGEQALTMRAVARAAGTNTPAVYRRFKSRREILQCLLRRIQDQIRETMARCRTIDEIGESYLEYALKHPHEYVLFYEHAHELSPRDPKARSRPIRESRPNLAFLEERLAEQLGGAAGDHTQVGLALWEAAHGTAMMLIQKALPEAHQDALRHAFAGTVRAILQASPSTFDGSVQQGVLLK